MCDASCSAEVVTSEWQAPNEVAATMNFVYSLGAGTEECRSCSTADICFCKIIYAAFRVECVQYMNVSRTFFRASHL